MIDLTPALVPALTPASAGFRACLDPTPRLLAKAQGVTEADALKKGLEVKAIEFVKKGSEVYQKV